MVEVLEGKHPFWVSGEGAPHKVLLNTRYEINNFRLKAYHGLEVFFDEPEPYLIVNLTSAAVFAHIVDSHSLLLVEFKTETGKRRVELPAGKVDHLVDKTIFDTAKREFTEETGGLMALSELMPLFVVHHHDEKGGLQFYTKIPKLGVERYDELERGYLTPPKGADGGKVAQLITEPINIFLNPDKTLLRFSQNQWAVNKIVRQTLGMHLLNSDTVRI